MNNSNYGTSILQFGELEGIVKHVSEVPNGLNCGVFCIKCGDKLIAKKGQKRIEHFAHYSIENCNGATETALHKMAKQIIQSKGYINLPIVKLRIGQQDQRFIFKKHYKLVFDAIKIETKQGSIVPDIILVKGNRKMYVEVAVTHFVDERKLEIIKDENTSMVEIDLSKYKGVTNISELEEVLIESTLNKKWLHNAWLEFIKSEINIVQQSKLEEYHFERDFSRDRWHTKCPISRTGYITINRCKICMHNVQVKTDHYYGGELSVICSGTNNSNIWSTIKRLGGSYH